MRIGVDFDDVLYPYHAYLKQRILKRFGVDLTGTRVTTFYYEQHPLLAARGVTRDQVWEEVRATWNEVEGHDEAEPLDSEAPSILADLAKRHRITVVSARTRDALPYVENFLRRHGIRHHDVKLDTFEKRGFDVLVDDFPKHAIENAESGGYSVLYTIDENSTFDESRHPRIIRAYSWKDVAAAVERIASRRRPVA